MTVQVLKSKRSIQMSAVVATIAGAIVLPLLVHLLPPVGGVPMGARLLPIFYAPLLAAIGFGPSAAITASLVTPLLNYALTHNPSYELSIIITIQLTVFSIVVSLIRTRWPRLWFAGPAAYLAGLAASTLVLAVVPIIPAPPTAFFANSLMTGLPGLVILLVINIAAVGYARAWQNDR